MAYVIDHKPSFDRDFVTLPKNLQRRVVRAFDDIREHAGEPRGAVIKRLKCYKKVWRYRTGDYRIIYHVHGPIVRLLAVGHRRHVYDRFCPPLDLPTEEDYAAAVEGLLTGEGDRVSALVEDVIEKVEEIRSSERERDEPLPGPITRDGLSKWLIPSEHHRTLLSCKTRDDLLRCEAPLEWVTRVLEHLYPRPADQIAQQPDLQLTVPEDLVRYAEGDLPGFLLRLDSEQDRYVDWALQGPTLIKGGPGSGKSTVALYRARALVEKGAGSILFTTYTNALVAFSRQLLERVMGDLPHDLEVSTLDSIAVAIVRRCDGKHLNIGGKGAYVAALNDAASHFAHQSSAKRERSLLTTRSAISRDYLIREIEWIIEGRNLRSVEEYLRTDRAGRGHRFDERTRRAMWRIHEHIQAFLDDQRRRIVTWGHVRSRALELVRSGEWSTRWDAVIVDEAQDLTPTALALCVELCRDRRGLFLTADASQSLYNRGFRWKDVHDELKVVGRTRILKKNYRSSRQIAAAASEILHDKGAGDEEVLDQVYVHTGPRPAVHVCESQDDQLLCITVGIEEAAKELRLPVSAAAVLVRTHELAEKAARDLEDWGLPARYMTSKDLDLKCPEVKVLTIHSAKGLEFPIVTLPFVEKGVLPQELESDEADEWDQHLAAERRLFYVGCTRAMRRLIVTCRKDRASPFLSDLSKSAWRWE